MGKDRPMGELNSSCAQAGRGRGGGENKVLLRERLDPQDQELIHISNTS